MLYLFLMPDRKTPPHGTKRPLRGQSQDERDAEGLAARREREAAAPGPEWDGEITGKYEGEELEEFRATRPIGARVGHLEKKHDGLLGDLKEVRADVKEVRADVKEFGGQVSNLRAEVSGAVGKLEGQEGVLKETLSIVKKSADRDHVTFTAKVDVDRAKELAKVELDKEQQLDKFSARRVRRKAVLKIIGFVASGGGIIELLHRLGVL